VEVYTSTILAVTFTWSSLGTWAEAICFPHGEWNSCNGDDRKYISNGFKGFTTEVNKFMTLVEEFTRRLNDDDFKLKKQEILEGNESDEYIDQTTPRVFHLSS